MFSNEPAARPAVSARCFSRTGHRHRLEGIGTRLLQSAPDALQAGGCTRAALWVLDSSAHAIGYYASRGFRDTGLTQGEGPLRERQMLLSLPTA